MKKVIASIVAVAGLSVAANAAVNSRVDVQVSLDGASWSNNVNILPGAGTQPVYVRTLVSYTGTAAPLGLASVGFQPTVSNWTGADTLSPFINGGAGGNTTTPLGVLTGSQLTDTTSFGRVSPFGRSALSSTSALKGFVHANPDGTGNTYLRIAQTQVTSWIGGTGNTSGNSGVAIAQLSDNGRTASDPAFNPSLQNVMVFKFGVTVDKTNARVLAIDIPAASFGNRDAVTGDREVYWFASMTEASGSIKGTALVLPATITIIPTPASLALLGMGGLAVSRRRRA
jgi:uncharacterized protein (TIGR03382 family)